LADSTTVLLYKLARAAVDAAIDEDPRRRVIVAFADDFPTDRYVVEGIAAECGGSVRWLHADIAAGVTADQVARAVAPDTALVLLSHVVYRSGWLTDAPAVAEAAHAAGAYVLLDLSRGLHGRLRQPIQGWMGRVDAFTMGPGYVPAPGARQLVSGTPPILAAVPLLASLDLLEEAGIDAVRAKSLALTDLALDLVDDWLAPFAVH